MSPAKETMIEELTKLAHQLKRIPTSRDIREHREISRTIGNHWEGMEILYKEVYGLDIPHKADREMLYNSWSGADEPSTIEFPNKKKGSKE